MMIRKNLKIRLFYHSVISDWNHGNAHFLRGIFLELTARGHNVLVLESYNNWSIENLIRYHSEESIKQFYKAFPKIRPVRYLPKHLNLEEQLDGVDLVIVHQWNDPKLVSEIGKHHKANRDYVLFFHDTHHYALTDRQNFLRYDLSQYDGVLTFGSALRDLYKEEGWAADAWTWHEAADIRTFYPRPTNGPARDLIWVGNWGDNERTQELDEFLIEPSRDLNLKTDVYGVQYPDEARNHLHNNGVDYKGWLPNYRVPEAFARCKVTVHVPRRPYSKSLKGIPTIRPFEALACGTPLISAPWADTEGLFRPGKDLLYANNGTQMKKYLHDLINDPAMAATFANNGMATIRERHTCAHRVNELLKIYGSLGQRKKYGFNREPSQPGSTSTVNA